MEATEAKPVKSTGAEADACCAGVQKPNRSRYMLIGGALLALTLALYAGWGWLTATGAAGVLLALAPCLAMCALGLCMGGKKKP